MWARTVAEYDLDTHHLVQLESVCKTMDRLAEAQAAVEEHGVTVEDRFGQLKPNPAVVTERQLRESLAKLIRQLDLDGEPNPSYRR